MRPSLAELQRWMQAVITHPIGAAAGVESAAAQQAIAISAAEVEQVVLPSRACSSLERLNVYAGAYYARLLECLRDFFPALRHALGDELFDRFAVGYLQQHPPASYTLDRLADHFVEFLEATRPDEARQDDDFMQLAGFVVDVARLEWNIAQVFDGPGEEREPPLSPDALLALSAERWAEARLEPAACLRLLAFRFPVNDYFTAFRAGERPAPPRPQTTWLALTRREYIVRRLPLSQPQHELLSSLAAGETVGASIERAALRCDDVDRFAEDLNSWFRDWAAAGLFRRRLVSP